MLKRSLAALFVAAFSMAAAAEDERPTRTLETVVVSGVQPGPGLWKVTKDDHVLWVMGTLTPLPKKMEWESRDVEKAIAESQELLLLPRAQISVEGGALKALTLMPSLMGARNNPDKKLLKEVVSPELYARWVPLKQKYLGKDSAVEKRRPIIAGFRLYEKAVERSGMSFKDVVTPVVKKAAKKHDLVITQPAVDVKIKDPRTRVKEFKKTTLDDSECFDKTLQRLESDVETMKLRGNAWAMGDVITLREEPYTDNTKACMDAVLGASMAEKTGLSTLPERIKDEWLKAAEAALAKNRSTFALLPIGNVLDDEKGFLAALKARGYTVEEP
jgi:hypothetical protein